MPRQPASVCLALGLLVAANLKVLAPLQAHSTVLLHACQIKFIWRQKERRQ